MGSFDCYCALCSGPLGTATVEFGSKNGKAILKRKRRVELKKRRLAGEEVIQSDDDDDDNEDDDSKISGKNCDAEGSENNREDESEQNNDSEENLSQPGSLNECDESFSYDPVKLKRKDVAWLDRSRTLGFNPEAEGVTKAFVSGLGCYDNYGSFVVDTPGQDRNDPLDDQYSCYGSFEPGKPPTFPFHEGCLQVFAMYLGLQKGDEIDRDVLYTVLAQNTEEFCSALSLDYGPIEGPEQIWTCFPGEEYLVSDPSYRENFGDVIQSLLPDKLFLKNAEPLSLECEAQNNPLRVLPYDVLYEIFTHLTLKDAKSFIASSQYIYISTRHGPFWKQMLRLHVFPWFWEASAILSNGTYSEDLDDKSLFLWLEATTRPNFGIDGPFMGIANRRRIWNTCKQLAPQYTEKILPEP
jgi:hypothetical protein